MTTPRSILLVQKKRLGDVLLTTPLIRALKKASPPWHVSYLTDRPSMRALEGNRYLDRLLVLPEASGYAAMARTVLPLRREKLDAAIDLMGHPLNAFAARLAAADLSIGPQGGGGSFLLDRAVPLATGAYTPLQKLALLGPLGVADDGLKLDFTPSVEDLAFARGLFRELGGDGPVALFFPTSRRPARRWPAERFAAAAGLLRERLGFLPLLVWGPGERAEVERVAALMPAPAAIAPPTSVGQVAALARLAAVAVTNNNGPMHLVRSQETPLVTIFGATRPENWSPGGPRNRDLIATDLDCLYCGRQECDSLQCMWAVSAESVVAAVEELMQGIDG